MGLGLLQALEADSLQRGFLGVSDTGLDLPFTIGAEPDRQGHHAVVSQHILKQGIQRGIVIIRNDHTFTKVVQDDAPGTASKPAKRGLVQLGLDSGTGAEAEQPDRFTAVALRHHEQSRPSVLARLRMADHRSVSVVDLAFFSSLRLDDSHRSGTLGSTQLAHEALHGLIAARKTLIGNQILPDGHGIAATTQTQFDDLLIRCAGAGRGRLWGGMDRLDRSRPPESVVTPLAGFDGARFPQPPGGRTAIPAARRYAPAVSRRTPVACSIRLSGHPSLPSATTCCFFSVLKTLLIPTEAYSACRRCQCPGPQFRWPVFR